MPTMYVMVGIPGSGKSTFAKSLNLPIVSTDEIRRELFGDASIQDNGHLVFRFAYERLKDHLDNGEDVVFDAMNLKRKDRKYLLDNFNCKHVAIYMNTPLEKCLDRNYNRDRVIPDEIIISKYLKLSEPKEYEGFDEVLEVKP